MKKHDTPKVVQKDLVAVKKEVDELVAEKEEWKARYLRSVADYQNLEKRMNSRLEEVRGFAAERLLGRMIPVMDMLVRAQQHIKDNGLDLVVKEFEKVLGAEGVQKLETVGRPFDPHQMECVQMVDGEPEIVQSEIEAGYTLQGKLIRVSKVTVGEKT